MKWSLQILLVFAVASACNKPRLSVPPCDSDLGYLGERVHLANVRFLREWRQIDWFAVYDNLEDRRSLKPAGNCIPVDTTIPTEREIERQEYSIRNLR